MPDKISDVCQHSPTFVEERHITSIRVEKNVQVPLHAVSHKKCKSRQISLEILFFFFIYGTSDGFWGKKLHEAAKFEHILESILVFFDTLDNFILI